MLVTDNLLLPTDSLIYAATEMDLMSNPLPHPSFLEFYRYRVHLTVTEPCRFFAFTGTAIRGLIGEALHTVSCRYQGENRVCSQCTLAENCVYSYFHRDDRPAPFAVVPLSDDLNMYHRQETMNAFRRGSVFSFELIIFGKANRYFEGSIIEALRYISNIPAGIRQQGDEIQGKGRLSLHSIETLTDESEPLVLYSNGVFTKGLSPVKIKAGQILMPTIPSGIQSLTINLETPLELKIKSRNINAEFGIPFSVFYLQLLQRISALANLYGNAPELPYINSNEPLLPAVSLSMSDFQDVSFRKYSRSQDRLMTLRGIIGKSSYKGDFAPYLPLLKLGQYTLAGKNTSFGFGKYSLSYE
jgi:hypothetical protein